MTSRSPLVAAALLGLASVASGQCELGALHPVDGGPIDRFGATVALDGNYAISGSVFHDGVGSNSGAAYMLRRQPDGSWKITQKLVASDETIDDRYGFRVDVAGFTAVVGARYNASFGYGTGAVYVYDLGGGQWNESAILRASDEQIGALFGTSTALSRDALIVGASAHSTTQFQDGAAYVFERSGGVWSETAKLVRSGADADDRFGIAADIDTTGGDAQAIVGASGADDVAVLGGAAHVFERIDGTWTETAALYAGDLGEGDQFGTAVAIDDDVAVVAAQLHDGTDFDTGAVYVFERIAGSWTQTAKLESRDPFDGGMFGSSVALDGRRVLVGSWIVDEGRGEATLFEDGGDGWTQVLRFAPGDLELGDHFGIDVALNGGDAIVGARGSKNGAGVMTGGAYAYAGLDGFSIVGSGCVGSAGIVPRLEPAGCTSPGGAVTVALTDALGGATAFLAVGLGTGGPLLPNGCTIHMDLPLILTVGPLPLSPGGAGDGALALPFAIPTGLPPVDVTLQAFVQDPGTPGLVLSNGLIVSLPGG